MLPDMRTVLHEQPRRHQEQSDVSDHRADDGERTRPYSCQGTMNVILAQELLRHSSTRFASARHTRSRRWRRASLSPRQRTNKAYSWMAPFLNRAPKYPKPNPI